MGYSYLVQGSWIWQKQSVSSIIQKHSPAEIIYVDSNDSFEDVVQKMSEYSCFDDNKIFLITGFPEAGEKNKSTARTKIMNGFKKNIPNLPNSTIIVFKNLNISSKPFLQVVQDNGELMVSSQNKTRGDGEKIVYSFFKKKDIEINSKLLEMIVDIYMSGKDVSVDLLYLFCCKLYSYASEKKDISKEDIEIIMSQHRDFVVWNMLDMLDNRGITSIINMMIPYIKNAKYPKIEMENVLRVMIWRYGLLLLCKSTGKVNTNDIYNDLSSIKKMKQSGVGRNIKMEAKDGVETDEYSKFNIMSVVGGRDGEPAIMKYTMNQLEYIYSLLVQTLTKIRTGVTENEGMFFIISVFMSICNEISGGERVCLEKALIPTGMHKEF